MSADNRHRSSDRNLQGGSPTEWTRTSGRQQVTAFRPHSSAPHGSSLHGNNSIQPDVHSTRSAFRYTASPRRSPNRNSNSQENYSNWMNATGSQEWRNPNSYYGTATNMPAATPSESHLSSWGFQEYSHEHPPHPSRQGPSSFSHTPCDSSKDKLSSKSVAALRLQQGGDSVFAPDLSATTPRGHLPQQQGENRHMGLPFSRISTTSSDVSAGEVYDNVRSFSPSSMSSGSKQHDSFGRSSDPVLEELKSSISEGNYMSFINEMDRRIGSTPGKAEKSLFIGGLRLFRFYVVRDQLSKPDVCVLSSADWVKAIITKTTTTFNNDKDVVIGCLLTFLTFSTLPGGNYNKFTINKGGVDMTLDMLDLFKMDEEVSDLANALILSLSRNKKDGLNAKYPKIEMLVRRLGNVLSNGEYGKDFAIRALFYLSFQRTKLSETQQKVSVDVTKALASESSIRLIIDSLNNEWVRQPTVEAALSLLWRKSPKATGEVVEGDGPFPITREVIETLIGVMDSFDSIPIREACCGIVANLAMRDTFPFEMSQPVFLSFLRFLNDEANVDEKLATCALHSICNLLQNPMSRTLLVSDERVVKTVLSLMEKYSTCLRLIEYGCLAIGHAGRNDCSVKETIMLLGGFDLVKRAFETSYASQESDPERRVEDASCCAIACLSGCYSGATAIESSGLLETMENILLVDPGDEDIKASMKVIVNNTRSGIFSGHLGNSEPDQFAHLVSAATSEGAVVQLFQCVVGSSQSNIGIAAGQGDGYAGYKALLSAMSKYIESPEVQEYGSILLAEMYFHLSFGVVEYPNHGLWSPSNLHETLQTIHSSMDSHRNNGAVQSYCCLAILNVFSPISDLHSYKQAVGGFLIDTCLRDILDSLSSHESYREVQKSGVAALGATVLVARQADLERWRVRIVDQIFASIQKFSVDFELLPLALDTLQLLMDINHGMEAIRDSPNIRTLLNLTQSESSEVAGRSCAVLASLCQTDFRASSYVMEYPDAIKLLLLGMASNQQELQIQIDLMSILETLVNSRNKIAFAKIHENNGIATLCNGLKKHSSRRTFVLLCCPILSTSIRLLGNSAETLPRDLLKESLMNAAVRYQEDADAEAVIFDALCACGQLDDGFKSLLKEAHVLEETNTSTMAGALYLGQIVVGAMQLNLGSADLQKGGCRLLWLLSSLEHGEETIGSFAGIQTIVNALLAHIDSADVQKEGLLALTRLATASQNTPMIDDPDPERVVKWSMWIHYRDPSVLSVALDFLTRRMNKPMMDENVLTIVVAAMSSFPVAEQLQKNACSYLNNCSYTPENMRMMNEKREQLVPLLRRAGDQFPQHCRAKAMSIERRLQHVNNV